MNNRILWILRTIFTSGFLGALTAQALLIIDSLGRDGLSRPPLLALVLVFVVGFGLIQFVIIAMVVALLIGGMALLVYGTRTLLARAIGFSTELETVI